MHIKWFQEIERSLKYAWRSRSLDFGLNWDRLPPEVRSFQFNGHPFHYRTGTNDISALNEVLFRTGSKSEYHFPIEEDPRLILDIGGHIGSASVLFATKYPGARIFTFEPMPDNFELLARNTAPYSNIRVFNCGLGSVTGEVLASGNSDALDTGGRSMVGESGLGGSKEYRIKIRSVADILRENSVSDPDFIKIDTEGAEHEILTAFPPGMLKRVKWIIGELHDVKDFELLAYLNQWFHVGLDKPKVRFRFSCFRAANRELVAKFGSYE